MKKVLFTFVGNQDPISNNTNMEGSIVTLVKSIKPDIIYAFPSAEGVGIKSSTQNNAEDTKFWIKDTIDSNIDMFIRTLGVKDPTDYIELISCMRKEISNILENELDGEFSKYELHANCSSGTPTMKSLWIVFSSIGFIPNLHLWQVGNPQLCDSRIKEINDGFLREENLISRIDKYSTNFQFQLAADSLLELSNITIYNSRKSKVNILVKILEGYAKWDLINYTEAIDKLKSARSLISSQVDMKNINDVLNIQIDILKNLNRKDYKESEYNLIDLYFNTKRRYNNNEYTEVLSRFWRIYEGMMFWIIAKKYKMDARNLTDSQYSKLKSVLNLNSKRLTLKNCDEYLSKVVKDKKFNEFKEIKIDDFYLKSEMDNLRKKRNSSIVAHGMKPIDANEAEHAIKILDLMIKSFLNDNIDDYPLNTINMKKIISGL